ncbi:MULTISPECIES: N-acetyltransferase [unclassified Paraburkholderia]|uniref:N-acetyltransferase n=1 Tax=unclassified Paraburkholderia TaxID=2615204 RepID=UPI002AB1EEF4|nr:MULTISPECIES: N-acetyltransferase [unclassified Paraburkholderia]
MNDSNRHERVDAARFSLRDLCEADLPAAQRFSEEAGWPHRLSDWQSLSALGTGRVVMCDGQISSLGQIFVWDEHAASISLLVSDAAHRAGEAEAVLLRDLIERAGTRSVTVHAFGHWRQAVERFGFRESGAVLQYQGRPRSAPLIAIPAGTRLRPASRADEAALCELDARANGMRRDRLIAAWLDQHVQAIVLDSEASEDGMLGFAFLRRFGRGTLIGPVVASEPQLAQALIAHLCGMAAGKFLRLDAVEQYAVPIGAWFESLGLTCVNRVPKMTLGDATPGAADLHTFAVAAQALG